MATDRFMARKQRTTLTHFALVGGPQADTSPGVTPVLDSNNVFPSANATEMLPRDGVEIRKRYRLTTEPVGRIAIVAETAPPDVNLGYLLMTIDTADGKNAITCGQFMRDRTQLSFENTVSNVTFANDVVGVDFNPWNMGVFRTGNLGNSATVRYRSVNGTAIGGVDYTAVNSSVTFDPGGAQINVVGTPILIFGTNKFFFIEFYDPGVGVNISQLSVLITIL